MSRVIVKNLPQKCSEKKLRELFSSCGEVTDVKLMKTRRGVFRKFGFVGFSLAEQAERALKDLNKTFIGATQIEVEVAKPYGDESLARPWSKYSEGSSAYRKREAGKTKKKMEEGGGEDGRKETRLGKMLKEYEELEVDPSFQEFLDVHKHGTKVKTWSDSTMLAEEGKGHDKGGRREVEEEGGQGLKDEEIEAPVGETESDEEQREDITTSQTTSDLNYLKSKVVKESGHGMESHDQPVSGSGVSDDESEASLGGEESDSILPMATTPYTVKMLGLPFNAKEKDIRSFFHPLKVVAIRLTQDPQGRPSGRGYADFQSEKDLREALKRNKDCIRHRYIELFRDDASFREKNVMQGDDGRTLKPWELKASLVDDSEVESVMESGRIFIRNLPFSTQEEDLTELFEKYGPLTEVIIPLDKTTNRPTGLGFVTFMLPEHAAKAYQELDGQIFQGRLLHLLPARPRHLQGEELTHQQTSFKKKKELKMRSEAGSAHNWNSLFLGANAVADVMAEKYSTEKSEIYDATSGTSAAVRVALGETQIVRETREFLQSHGVNLEVFEQNKPKRSKNIIMIKNLPSGVANSEISKLFQPFGQLLKVIMPPAGISALVEYAEASHARKAFSKLAYSSFKHLPLYLEWAPVGVLNKKEPRNESKSEDETDEIKECSTSTIFIKNLNFSTNEDTLLQLFSQVAEVKSLNIARKRNPKDSASPLSMGFGFVEFADETAALEVLKQLQHSKVDDHTLELKLSHHKTRPSPSSSQGAKKLPITTKQKTSKILVRNIPFEANSQEVKDLFCTFGALKKVRLPKKLSAGSGDHRGFGFVEFVSKEDARKAFDSLSHSTHLYGRRLVLEWAEQEESLDAIRKRTAEHFHGFKFPRAKRSKAEEKTLKNNLETSRS